VVMVDRAAVALALSGLHGRVLAIGYGDVPAAVQLDRPRYRASVSRSRGLLRNHAACSEP